MDFQEGAIIPIDKPYRMSSFGALAHVRYLISKKLGVKRVKTGHAGTLDPLATGVLLICTGRATKLIDQLQAQTKEYVATLRYGATTPSYDREHTVNFTYPSAHITRELVVKTLQQFAGAFGPDRQACVCREISKVHEEAVRGSLEELVNHFTTTPPKGEIVIVVKGGKD